MYGWLEPRTDIVRDRSWFGLEMDPTLKTRWEEFQLARSELKSRPPGRVLDAGCGFEPGVHVMPEISAGLGWHVEAIDCLEGKWRAMADKVPAFAPNPRIIRSERDMTDTGYAAESFDAYLCISVLEHMTPQDRDRSLHEADRVLRPGGLLLVTADGMWPHIGLKYDWGAPFIPRDPLTTEDGLPVAFVFGTKP